MIAEPDATVAGSAASSHAPVTTGTNSIAASEGNVNSPARAVNPQDPPAATLRKGLKHASKAFESELGDLRDRAKTLADFEDRARAVAPDKPPAATLSAGLNAYKRAKEAGRTSDSELGGRVREVAAVLRDREKQLSERLQKQFGPMLSQWSAEIDPKTLTVRFQRPDLLFEQGNSTLRPAFKAILAEMFPQYLAILHEFRDDIEEVRIEGHTSSEWADNSSPLQAYFGNMALSQDRTRTVLEYGLTKTDAAPSTLDWARRYITANELSSSRLRMVKDGSVEDRVASRRVEFWVLMRTHERLFKVVDTDG